MSTLDSLQHRTRKHSTRLKVKKKIIVIGAGLAGLSSAYELAKRGHEVIVLEARDRVGGRIETIKTNGFFAEAGAYWLNNKHAVTWSYIKELGIASSFKEISLENNYLLFHIRNNQVRANLAPTDSWPATLNLSPQEKRMGLGGILSTIFGDRKLVGDPSEPGWPSIPIKKRYGKKNFLEFLRSSHRSRIPGTNKYIPYIPSPGAIELIRPWFAWWDDLDNLSALAMIQYGITGQRLCDDRNDPAKWSVSKKGMDILPKQFHSELTKLDVTIRKSCPVVAISTDRDGVTVEFQSSSGEQQLRGHYVISAIPTTTMKNVAIMPPLSKSKSEAIHALRYASVARVYLQLKSGVTDLKNGTGFTDMPIGNLLDMSFCHPKGPGKLLQGFMVGEQARLFLGMTPKQKEIFAKSQMKILFPQFSEKDVNAFEYKCWDDKDRDPWASGAYPIFTPDSFSLVSKLAKRERQIVFAGEHTSAYSAWMEGALRSGCRAAREIDPGVPERR